MTLPFPLALVAALVPALAACGSNATPAVAPATTSPSATPSATAPIPAQPVRHALADGSLYPISRRVDAHETIFGTDVADPYRWLEDGASDEVHTWAHAQDELARTELAKLPDRDAIAARVKELIYVPGISTPTKLGNRYFYTRRDPTKEKGVVYWKEGKTGAEKILLDPNTWSTDGSVALGGWQGSWDGKKVAYKVKEHNSDEATMHVIDVATGVISPIDTIDGAKYAGASWTPKGDGFYYTYLPNPPGGSVADRPGLQEVRFHKLGDDPKKDAVVREKTGNPTFFLGADLSRDGHWLFLHIQHGWTSEDVYFQDLRSKTPKEWIPLSVGHAAFFNVEAYKDRFYVKTNDGAPKAHVYAIDPAHHEKSAWKEIVPTRPDATLEDMTVVGGKLSLRYLKDVITHLEIHDLDGKLVREVAQPAIGSASNLVGNQDDDETYYSFTSFTYPTEIYETSVKTGKQSLFFKLTVPVDGSKYEVEQIFFTSKDGTRVPMFVVHAKGLVKDGSAPAILYGYGGFLSSQTPGFQATMFPWLEHGGVYAIANLRGGSEYGEEWHQAGMKHVKQHVFDDYIAAAEALIHEGFTKADRLAARGGSNGGLLVGAAITQRPDLFAVGLCGVPLLDMVRYHKFGSGKTWISEYGSADDAEDFKSIYAYSPYHHVTPGTKYPAVLLLSADSDDRVDPMHARKFAAELQDASTGGPVLLRIEHNSGHGGADMLKSTVMKVADEYAFALGNMSTRK